MDQHASTTPTYQRVCRRCSAQSTTSEPACPSCGTPFMRRGLRPSRRMAVVAAVVVALLASGGTAWGIDRHRAGVERDEAAAAAADAAEQARSDEAEAQETADEVERTARADTVDELEKNITKHARRAVKNGLLDGPIEYSSCTATGGSVDDLTALTSTFDCIAVNEERDDGTASGYQYTGTADWSSGELTWQLGG